MSRAGAGALVALLAVGLSWSAGRVARSTFEDEPRPPPAGRILPASTGYMAEIAIQFHRGTGGEMFLPVYEELFEALTGNTTVWVVVADREDERIFDAIRRRWVGGPMVVRYVHVGKRITNWARDRMAVLADADGAPILVAPPTAHAGARARANDWEVPWALRRALGPAARIVDAPFLFDGGDLIADDAHVYVASPLLARNPARDPRAFLRQIEELTGRPVVMLGEEADPSPDHHVGMFVTPLGGGIVAYADPALGSEILFGDGTAVGPPLVEAGGVSYEVDETEETRERFARVGEDLRRAGLTAVPLPMVPTTAPFVWLGYDNVLVDQRADGLHVLMPVYGVEALDEAAADAYRALGATVHPIDVSAIFHHGGTVRCLAAVLRRDTPW